MAYLGRVGARKEDDRTALRQFAVLFIVALAILVTRNAEPVRAAAGALTGALVPVEAALAQVGGGVGAFTETVRQIQELRAENGRLRDQIDQLTLENVRLREAAINAQQAAKLNEAAARIPYETVAAPVISRDPSGILQTVLLGVGSDAGVRVGNVVVSEQGVVGRVSEVGSGYSKVLLITDPGSNVSAIVQGSRATGIVRGQYGDTLVMEWILQTEKVEVGDVVITAGLALGDELRSLYPKGLVIGTVGALDRAENSAYKRAILLPAVDLRRLEHVLIVKAPAPAAR
ncbi:MAG: rod shape-determining protein MreC [Chloroflexi bacterium]|nr:rod shape-determining protein MreC [Chloroflexota bacterium]